MCWFKSSRPHHFRRSSPTFGSEDALSGGSSAHAPRFDEEPLNLKESIPTLCGMDLILLGPSTSQELKEKVQQERVEIYVRA